MIKEIKLQNFKAFDRLNIKLKPLTLFLGPNNSGKSSILSSLRILAQTVESYDSNVPLLLNGVLGDFGSFKDVVHKNNKTRKLRIDLTISPTPISSHFGISRTNYNYNEIRIELCYKYRTKRREIILDGTKLFMDNKQIISTSYSIETERQNVEFIGNIEIPSTIKAKISELFRFQNFIPQRFFSGSLLKGSTGDFINEEIERIIRNTNIVSNMIYRTLMSIEYVGAIRVPPTRTFIYSGESRAKIGASGQFAANLLAIDASRGGKKSKNIIKNIKDWMNKSGMASDIKIVPISERHYELKIQHPVTKEYENYSDVGFGHSQVLPVLVGGFNLQPYSTFIVEQPEIHLHPKAQAELGDFFLKLYEKNVQALIETHSEHLIMRLQRYIIEGKINPNDLVIYFVHASSEKKQITEIQIDENGKFTSEWPEGFFPERLEEAKEIAKLRFEKQNIK